MITDNKTYTNMIYDHKGKCIGFNDNDAEAQEIANTIGGRVEVEEVVDNAYNDERYSGCPDCGSYEGDYYDCPECGRSVPG